MKSGFPSFYRSLAATVILAAVGILVLKNWRSDPVERARSGTDGTFNVRRLTLEEFPQWLREESHNREWATHSGDQLTLSRSTLEESLRLGRSYFLNNQKAAGTFNYTYDFVTQRLDIEDNQVRQAGTLWGLSLVYQFQPDAETRQALDRGLDFFIGHTCPGGTQKALAIAYPGETECNSGTVALAALAMIEYLRASKTGHLTLTEARRLQVQATLDGYLRHLEFMQLENKHFSQSWSLRKKKKAPVWNAYCDGETLLCFIKAAKYLEHSRLVPLIENTALLFAKHYTVDQWRVNMDSALTKGFFQWSCMAFWEYRDTGWKNATISDDYLLALGWWMIHVHRTLERVRNTAYAFEGIIPSYAVAKERGEVRAVKDLGWTIDQAMSKLTSWQVGGPLSDQNPFLKRHPTQDPLAIGGIMNAQNEALLRIDVTQHQMHAVILALRHVYTNRVQTPAGSEAPQ